MSQPLHAFARHLWLAAAWCLFALASAQPTRAQTFELAYNPQVSLPLTITTGVWVLGSELAKPWLTADGCRWCDRTADGRDTLNPIDAGLRRALLWRNTAAGNLLSHVVAYGVVPLMAAGSLALAQWHRGGLSRLPVDLLVVLEAGMVALSLSQIVKFSTGRQRPYAHARQGMDPASYVRSSDDDVSFYSGHTSATIAVAVAAGSVALLRGYRSAAWVWVPGLVLAAATAYLRVASDRHYVSDVWVGSLVGAGVGVAVPWLLHARRVASAPQPSVAGVPGGAMLTLTWLR